MSEAPAATFRPQQSATTTLAEERWLFVDGAQAFGGHEVMLLRWLEELSLQRSIKAFLLARAGSQLQRDAAQFTTVAVLPAHGSGAVARLLGQLRDTVGFIRTAMATKPQLCIVAEGCLLSQPVFAFIARLIGLRVIEYVPLTQTSKSMGFRSGPLRDAFVRHVYSRVLHGWITITKEQADDFRAWAGVKRPIFTLPNTVARSIEAARIAESARPRSAGACARLRLVVLGRIEAHQKGLDALLEFLGAHPQLGSRYELSFVGTGPYEAELASRLANDSALASFVSLKPWSPTVEALQSHDVLMLSSRYEGVPLVMLEAMALGVPVVAPDLAGIRPYLDADSLFAKGDMAGAFRAIERLVDSELRCEVARRNRSEFERLASNAAFEVAVKSLTQQIRALGLSEARSA
jgi:glycosyltransferase involved in cell wall biosynthesis